MRRAHVLAVVAGLSCGAVMLGWQRAERAPRMPHAFAVKIDTPTETAAPALPAAGQVHTEPKRVESQPLSLPVGTSQGDLSAEFRRSQACVLPYRRAMTLQNQLDVCKAGGAGSPRCDDASQNALKEKLAEQARSVANCGADISALEVNYYRSTLDAAIHGDPDAQLCFVESRFQLGRRWSDEEVSFYKANALTFLLQALERGDWRAVQLLATPQRVLAHGKRSLLPLLVPESALEKYKLNRLLRIGAVEDYASQLDVIAGVGDAALTPEDRKFAEDWARKEFEKYFRNSPMLHEAPQACVPH